MKYLTSLYLVALVAVPSVALAESGGGPTSHQWGNSQNSLTDGSDDTSFNLGGPKKPQKKSSVISTHETENSDQGEEATLVGNGGSSDTSYDMGSKSGIRKPASSHKSAIKKISNGGSVVRHENEQDASNSAPTPTTPPAPGTKPIVRGGVSLNGSRTLMGSYGLYSPVVLPQSDGTKRIFLGGWASSSDDQDFLRLLLQENADPKEIYGPDRIYTGMLNDAADNPVQDLKLAFVMKGYHVNDPTIVRPPSEPGVDRSQWLYMYFTMLSNEVAKRCFTTQQNLLNCPEIFTSHDIGFASSIDGGLSWTFRGIVVAAANSGDGNGAWMPSVVKRDDELWLYYSTGRQNFNQENTFRIRLKANGHEKIDAPEPVRIAGFTPGANPVNIEVVPYERNGERFLMLGNDIGQNSIVAYDSEDGLRFNPLPGVVKDPLPKLLLRNGPTMISPFIESVFVNDLSGPSTVTGSEAASPKPPLYIKLLYSSQHSPIKWELKRAEVNVSR